MAQGSQIVQKTKRTHVKSEWGLGRGEAGGVEARRGVLPQPKPPLAFHMQFFSYSRLSGSLEQAKFFYDK